MKTILNALLLSKFPKAHFCGSKREFLSGHKYRSYLKICQIFFLRGAQGELLITFLLKKTPKWLPFYRFIAVFRVFPSIP